MEQEKKKIVIDANLIIGAYWNRGSSSWNIIKGSMDGLFLHFYTSRIEREVFRILRNIHSSQDYTEKIRALYRAGEKVAGVRRLRVIGDDPDDDKYLECAEECLAHYIISNDKHLLKLKSFHGIEIIRPAELVTILC